MYGEHWTRGRLSPRNEQLFSLLTSPPIPRCIGRAYLSRMVDKRNWITPMESQQ